MLLFAVNIHVLNGLNNLLFSVFNVEVLRNLPQLLMCLVLPIMKTIDSHIGLVVEFLYYFAGSSPELTVYETHLSKYSIF